MALQRNIHRQLGLVAAAVAAVVLAAAPALSQQAGTSQEKGLVDILSGLLGGGASTPSADGVVKGRCESRNNQRTYCAVDTSGGVRLTRQLSQSPCTDHWGFDAGGIWVDQGCRAEFEVGAPVAAAAATATPTPGVVLTTIDEVVVCESLDGKRAFCSADTARGVELRRALAGSDCTGRWGYDANGIWVDKGCRAEFRLVPPPATPTPVPTAGPTILACRSTDGRRVSCAGDTSGGVRFVRQLGQVDCRGKWGYDSGGVWVTNSCQAEFELAAAASAPAPPVKQEVVCESRANARQLCPATVTSSIRLSRELSAASCRGNWGFDGTSLWVDHGCRAVFVVE